MKVRWVCRIAISTCIFRHVWAASGRSPSNGVHGSYASVGSNSSQHLRTCSYVAAFTPGASTSSAQVHLAADVDNVVLLLTRPLLKALAKQWRPSQPLCLGGAVPSKLADEVLCFNKFNAPMQKEETSCQSCAANTEAVLRQVQPRASLQPTAGTAAGQNTMKNATLHLYAIRTTDAMEGKTQLWMRAANVVGVQVGFIHDDRDLPCAVFVGSRLGHRCSIRYGDKAVRALVETSEMLSRCVAASPATRAVFNTLLALLNQNIILGGSGTARTMLCGEAVAIMLLAIMNSTKRPICGVPAASCWTSS
jgi:hypothetical protein